MKIVDLNGGEIEVGNLDLALMQADDYRHYRVSQPTENDLKRYAYWQDLYEKLYALKAQNQ